jgi:hypothetical protein
LPNPYNYKFDEDSQSYHFTTKNTIEYRVAFIIDETFSAVSGFEINNIFQIVVEKVSDELESLDMRVSATIQSIIIAFFMHSQNSMIYVCDDKDKKGIKRFNMFNRWYEKSTNIDIVKIDNIINCDSNDQNLIIYSSLLYHQDNQNKKTILEVYNTIQEILEEK